MFAVGEFFPTEQKRHKKRIERYKENQKLFRGKHYDVFERVHQRLTQSQRDTVYITANFPGLICKKSADFLFGETPTFSAGNGKDHSPEQETIERLVQENRLHIINYESALGNAYRGDAFYKVRYSQHYDGFLDESIDPYRIIIEQQKAEYVFPEPLPTNENLIFAYHIAYPVLYERDGKDDWQLFVESHYPGLIKYRKLRMEPITYNMDNKVKQWRIYAEIPPKEGEKREVTTGVPFPLVVHVPNYGTDESWEGIDDLTEHKAIFDEIDNRLSQIANILDKHADPAMAVPTGSLEEDDNGQPMFHASRDKVFEVDEKDVVPKYITWDGQLMAAFKELETLLDFLLTTAELPPVALGRDNSGTSHTSGAAVKFRMNSLLAKINRKRQYYAEGLAKVLYIAQLLEHAQSPVKPGYEPTVPKIQFKDGLPDDELEMANLTSIRTGGKPTLSQKTALMRVDDMTEEQAEAELERIRREEQEEMPVDSSIFNESEDVEEDTE
ncbi:phage portal protein [Paenibacillus larvae]|uniref:phage portal protein n=1 Tax=Paenibacillus larvae TaxID=1464 RepID=UPI0015582BCF